MIAAIVCASRGNDPPPHFKPMAAFMKIGDIKGESVVAPDERIGISSSKITAIKLPNSQLVGVATASRRSWGTICTSGPMVGLTLKVDAGGTMDFSKADGFMSSATSGVNSPSRNTLHGGTIFYLKDVSSGLRGQGSSGDTVTSGDGTDSISSNRESGFASNEISLDTTTAPHDWDVICDIGTSIKATSVADALTNYRPEGFSKQPLRH